MVAIPKPVRQPIDVVADQMQLVVKDEVDQAAVGDEHVPEEERHDDPAGDDGQVVERPEKRAAGHARVEEDRYRHAEHDLCGVRSYRV